MSPVIEPDPPADDRLRTALRHAPDAELVAPAELGAQIRAAAWRAVAEPAARPLPATPGWPARLWGWFGRPGRLGASGVIATVLMAGVLGLVWRGEVPSPTVPDAAPTGAPMAPAAPAAPAAPKTAPEVMAAAEPTPPAPPSAVARQAKGATEPRAKPAPGAETTAPPAATTATTTTTATAGAEQATSDRAAPAAPRSTAPDGQRAKTQSASPMGATNAADPNLDIAGWLDDAATRMDAAAWLKPLAAATRGRWRWAAAPDGLLPPITLDSPNDGRGTLALTLGSDAVWGCQQAAGGAERCQRAPLSAEQLTELRGLWPPRR